MMRAMFLAVVFILLTAATGGVVAGAEAKREVRGTVEEFDMTTGRVVVDGQDYFIPMTGEGLRPKAGDKISFTYEEQGGRKVVTSVDQSQ